MQSLQVLAYLSDHECEALQSEGTYYLQDIFCLSGIMAFRNFRHVALAMHAMPETVADMMNSSIPDLCAQPQLNPQVALQNIVTDWLAAGCPHLHANT